MSSKLTINSIELKKNGQEVVLNYEQLMTAQGTEPFKDKNKKNRGKKPSEDLINTFVKMVPHLMYATQLFKVGPTSDDFFEFGFLVQEEFKGINVTSVVVSGKERDFVQLSGEKVTDKLEVVIFKTPPIWLEDVSEKAYPFINKLKDNLDDLMSEAEKYFNGKYEAEAQQALFS